MRGPDPSIQGDRSVACSGPSARGPRVTNGGVATNSPTHRCRPGSWPYCFHPATGAGTTAVVWRGRGLRMEWLLSEGLLDHEVAGGGVGAFDEAEAFDALLGVAPHRHGAAEHHAAFRPVHRRHGQNGEPAAHLGASRVTS